MSLQRFECEGWEVHCLPEDGGRLARLAYHGRDLLTAAPRAFRPPASDYGQYETRPVYGYDDCFPSVDPCCHPDWGDIADHGELCWLEWACETGRDTLSLATRSRVLPLTFRRTLRFFPGELVWQFEVSNHHALDLPMLHVMHALLPLERVCGITVPAFAVAVDEIDEQPAELAGPKAVSEFLMGRPCGSAAMLLLRGVEAGMYEVMFREGWRLQVHYDSGLFPTLGIWWNRDSYPDEDGRRRTECALEPIPGEWSSLARSCEEGRVPLIPPGSTLDWEVAWIVREEG
jgi:hypothetical protein